MIQNPLIQYFDVTIRLQLIQAILNTGKEEIENLENFSSIGFNRFSKLLVIQVNVLS